MSRELKLCLADVRGASARLSEINGRCKAVIRARRVANAQTDRKWGEERGPRRFRRGYQRSLDSAITQMEQITDDVDEMIGRVLQAADRLEDTIRDEAMKLSQVSQEGGLR